MIQTVEWGVRWTGGPQEGSTWRYTGRMQAEHGLKMQGDEGVIVTRTVTTSDWAEVEPDTEPERCTYTWGEERCPMPANHTGRHVFDPFCHRCKVLHPSEQDCPS